MITNRIKIEFVGHVGYYDIHLLAAKGLKRLFATNTDDGTITCPETLVERKDLGNVDYNMCVDIFQHIWMSTGTDEEFKISEINWKHVGKTPDEVTIRAFANRFGFTDVFKFHDEDPGTDFASRATINSLFITKFNLEETGFLADMTTVENE